MPPGTGDTGRLLTLFDPSAGLPGFADDEEIEPPVGVTATVVASVSVLSVYAVTTGSGSVVAVAAAGETGAKAIRKWPL